MGSPAEAAGGKPERVGGGGGEFLGTKFGALTDAKLRQGKTRSPNDQERPADARDPSTDS